MVQKKGRKAGKRKKSVAKAGKSLKEAEIEALTSFEMPEAPKPNRKAHASAEDIFLAALAYLWILFLIPILRRRKDAFVDFHAKQGFVFFVTSILLFLVSLIPAVAFTVAPFLWLLFFLGWLVALLCALGGKVWKAPLLGHIAGKLRL
ncbi:hypothetical protein HY501_03425 [Candidatus Woesearchaeota archaeon]|nr:hypothetical protein [Candidatus Woesearchaeota archaeon]